MLRPGDLWRTLDTWERESAPGKGLSENATKKTEKVSGQNEKAFFVLNISVVCLKFHSL